MKNKQVKFFFQFNDKNICMRFYTLISNFLGGGTTGEGEKYFYFLSY